MQASKIFKGGWLAYQRTKGRKRSTIRTRLELWQVYDIPPTVNNCWLSHNATLSMDATTYQDHLIPLPPLYHNTHQVSSLTYNMHDRPWTLASHTHHDLLLHLIVVRYQFVQFDSFKKILDPKVIQCSPIVRETDVQSQVESYQRLKKWYLMSPCLILSIIR